jgi:hypothetical protein
MNPDAKALPNHLQIHNHCQGSRQLKFPKNAATDVIASLRWCQASALREELFEYFF